MIQWNRLRRLTMPSSNKLIMALAFVLGVLIGVAAWMFIRLIEWAQFWPAVFGSSKFLFLTVNRFWAVAIPTIGGLLCGLVVQFLEPGAKGTGTAEIIYTVRRKQGHIPGRYTFFKTLASVFTVCSGGSAGPEAPIVAVGAGIGSNLGERWGLSSDAIKNLAVAGAAAGFAAVFNAPIAGVLFAVEVLLRDFDSQSFTMVLLCTFTASVTTRWLLGNRVFIQLPATYSFHAADELVFYALLGLLAAIVSKLFIQIYFFIDHQMERWTRAPLAVKTMTGGLLVGLMGLYIPETLGNGHLVIPHLLSAEIAQPKPLSSLLLLLIAKTLSCPLTVASGGSGGIFIPFLLIGETLGGVVGRFAHWMMPGAGPSWAYMLIGMSAVFSGITYAPFTGILLLFELTNDYNVILPAMFAVVITMGVARMLDRHSIEGHKLMRKGVLLHDAIELRAIEKYQAQDVMAKDVKLLSEEMSLEELSGMLLKHPHTGYPVIDGKGNLTGLLTFSEIHRAFGASSHENHGKTVRHIMRPDFPTVEPDKSLADVVRLMHHYNVDRVIVIEPSAPTRVAGVITQDSLLSIYHKHLD